MKNIIILMLILVTVFSCKSKEQKLCEEMSRGSSSKYKEGCKCIVKAAKDNNVENFEDFIKALQQAEKLSKLIISQVLFDKNLGKKSESYIKTLEDIFLCDLNDKPVEDNLLRDGDNYVSAIPGFVHPMEFDLKTQKQEVIQYIKDRVKKDYCNKTIDMCNDSTLRMMEELNLDSFKKLIEAKNRKVMDRVIKDYCNGLVDMCNYSTILMMYEENLTSSQQNLKW